MEELKQIRLDIIDRMSKIKYPKNKYTVSIEEQLYNNLKIMLSMIDDYIYYNRPEMISFTEVQLDYTLYGRKYIELQSRNDYRDGYN